MHAQPTITVNASKSVRVVDNRMFGLNTAVWDSAFTDSQSLASLQAVDAQFLRYPGGSSADDYNWQTNSAVMEGGSAGTTTFDDFAAYAKSINAQVIITANYGTGTPQMAAAWVQYSNVTKGYGFKYWEVGNECYGTWEDDSNTPAHNPVEYGTRAAQYIQAMKAVDPTIKVGVVADASEDSYVNGNTVSVTNPVTNASHVGFTPVMLVTMKNLGVLPDFIIYHNYAQNNNQENDATLLQFSSSWSTFATQLRAQLTDYLGSAGAGIELLCTENNSVSQDPGKQTTSLVNGLYYADSLGSLMQTEFNSLVWWAFHNGPDTAANNSSALYGWRQYGDYGIENGDNTSFGTITVPTHDPYPTYYVQKLLTHFARGGDTVVTASSSDTLLTPYAVMRKDGSLSLLVINKNPTAAYSPTITVSGFAPQPNATVYSYGIPQDLNSEENDSLAAAPATGYSWENTLDGWVNQSGQPDTTATNYGLEAPFLYTLAFSSTMGVTKGTYSLACTTTAAAPGDSAVIQNSSGSLGTAMSTADSVSLDIYPQVAAGTTVQASIYINGTSIPYVLLGTATLNVNQENTVTFPVTSAQRAGVLSSLATGNYFQVGINIDSPVALTAFLDNFVVTPVAGSSPTPTPTPIAGAAASPDIAVSTISNAGASFSASFGPYSATVISLVPPVLSPTASVQPQSQTVASGHTVVFSFPTTGSPAPTYQWSLNGSPISGATGATLQIGGATAGDAGTYTCTATNSSGSLVSNPASLTVDTTSNPGRLTNISCRAQVGTGANILIAGFAIGGNGTSGSQSVLVRASGPALGAFGLSGLLADPQLQIFQGSGQAALFTNNGWAGSSQISAAAAQVGAFAWSSTSSHDSALLETLSAGSYSAQVSGQSGDTGVALAEVYDATASGTYTPSSPRLINISSLVQVGTGANILIAGFSISGSTSVTVLVRASGPALSTFGVPGRLADPELKLYRSNPDGSSTLLLTNTGWGGDPKIAADAASTGAFSWGASATPDSAILTTLAPGSYTAQISGASGDAGEALVEVYEVQ
ncbi:MAG TPA: immunoglobulin domain-containing protein [Opitutaceae bacterium]